MPGVEQLTVIGDSGLLKHAEVALFCSVRCPAAIILKTYDLAQQWRAKEVGVISGFHSPIEQEVLVTLLRGQGPIVVCPARAIDNLRVPTEWKAPIESGRLLIVSPFSPKQNRATQKNASLRNRLVAALAQQVFIAYAAPGGKTEAFASELIQAGKTVLSFDSPDTPNLLEMGAKVVS